MGKKTVQALQKLNKLKKFELDQKRHALAEMQARLRALNEEAQGIHKQQLSEIELARDHHEARVNLPLYLEGLRKSETKLKQKIFQFADFMIPVEESVREAYKEVKALELAIKNLQDKMRYSQEQHEQQEHDELSQYKRKVAWDD